MKTASGSLQLCASLEVGIEGETYAKSQRRQERTASAPEGRVEEELEEGSRTAGCDVDRDRDAATVVGVREVLVPPAGTKSKEEGKRRASNNLRTAMEDMEIGEDEIDKVEAAEAEGDDTEAEGGGGLAGALLVLESTGLLTHDADPGGTTLVD